MAYDTMHTVAWTRMEHCPAQQLYKPGKVTDAGFDICSAEDKVILPYNQTAFTLQRVERSNGSFIKVEDVAPEETNVYKLQVDNEGYILRPKYEGVLVKTGIKVHPMDLMNTRIYSRSSAVKMGVSLANSVGIVDF